MLHFTLNTKKLILIETAVKRVKENLSAKFVVMCATGRTPQDKCEDIAPDQ